MNVLKREGLVTGMWGQVVLQKWKHHVPRSLASSSRLCLQSRIQKQYFGRGSASVGTAVRLRCINVDSTKADCPSYPHVKASSWRRELKAIQPVVSRSHASNIHIYTQAEHIYRLALGSLNYRSRKMLATRVGCFCAWGHGASGCKWMLTQKLQQ